MQLYKGNILYTPQLGSLIALNQGYIAVDDTGLIEGVYETLPAKYAGCPVADYKDKLILPAFSDLHIHSSQLPIAGLGYDLGGNLWFEECATPIEKKYTDSSYAAEINKALVEELWKNGVLHSVILSSCAKGSTKNLMEQMEEASLAGYVGKMNADYPAFAPAPETTEASIAETRQLIEWSQKKGGRVKYILSPEFVPTASEELLTYLGDAAAEYGLPVQSHMSEADFDTKCVAERFPQWGNYAATLAHYGLFGGGAGEVVMAHCLNCQPHEIALMAKNKVFAAHCPASNFHSPSGRLFPARDFINAGVPVAICSDFGGGHTLNQMQGMVAAIHTSKLFFDKQPLTSTEAFYLATKSPGAFFGNTGSFEKGYWFDALVIDDSELNRFADYTLAERLQRFIYKGCSSQIAQRYLQGRLLEL